MITSASVASALATFDQGRKSYVTDDPQ
jgi:hypothetical protein